MEKINLLISVKNLEYGEALGNAISNLHNAFQITVEKNENNIEDYIIILEKNGDAVKIKLSEEITSENIKVENLESYCAPLSIYKYDNISEIIRAINIICSTIKGKPILFQNTGKSQYICGIGGAGGVGVSSILIGLGREFSRFRDKKVLYISFEDFESSKYFLEMQWNKRQINHYLYYFFKSKSENNQLPLDSFLNQDSYGLYLFSPSMSHNDLTELCKKEIELLLSYISLYENFDYIFLDLQTNIKEETIYLMEWCANILLVSEDTPISNGKANSLYEYLTNDFLHHDMEKIIKIKNKCQEEKENEDLNTIKIPLDSGSFCTKENYIDISIENVFGLGLKEIGRKIIGC